MCDLFANLNDSNSALTEFNRENFETLFGIKAYADRVIKKDNDENVYKVKEKWIMPFDVGDCEDRVIFELLSLIYSGFNPSQLHIIIVYSPVYNSDGTIKVDIENKIEREGHAVLGVNLYINGKIITLISDIKNDNIITVDEMVNDKKYEIHSMSSVAFEQSEAINKEGEQKYKVKFFSVETRKN